MNLEILNKYIKDGLLYSQTHPTLPLTIYNYTDKVQWENLWDEVTLQCRGLVVDNLGNTVARPFKKFFNLSENKTIVTDKYEIYEKYDGSLGILFFYGGNWILASRGSFTSDQAIRGKQILDKICDYNLLDEDDTYCLEIIYPENKIVVDYDDLKTCILTAIFNTKSGQEKELIEVLPISKKYSFRTPLNELHTVINNTEEGYVIRFYNGERCKVKGAEYLRLHKLMSEMSTTAVWNCLKNKDSILNIIEGYPDEWYNTIKDYEDYLTSLFEFAKSTIKLKYITLPKVENDKEFAFLVKEDEYKSYLFSLRKGRDIEQQIWNNLKPEYKRL